MRISDEFPVLYEVWYAAELFLCAGYPGNEVLQLVAVDEAKWRKCYENYSRLHYANTSWVRSAFLDAGLPDPDDPALFAHLTAGGQIDTVADAEDLGAGARFKELRRKVEADPHIGPFAAVDWQAVYIGERSFPPILYVHDGRYVRVNGLPLRERKGEVIEGIDPHSFRVLGNRWFRDNKRVYCQAETTMLCFWIVVRGADPDSFEALNEWYARDNAAGYYVNETNRRFPSTEPGAFEIVAHHGYFFGEGPRFGLHDKKSVVIKDHQNVYYSGRLIEGAHAPSFQAIDDEGGYFADAKRIYFRATPIEGADRGSFTCVAEVGQYRAFDKHLPYSSGMPRSIADEYDCDSWLQFFRSHPEFADTWWHREDARRNAQTNEPQALSPLGGPYFSDGKRVFVQGRKWDGEPKWCSLDHFDLPSFRHLAACFAEDKSGLRYFTPRYVEYGEQAIKGGDPSTFETLGNHWYRDAKQVYYFNTDDETPSTELISLKVDMPTFRLLGGAYALDAKGLICAGVRKLTIADASSVIGLGYLHARMGDSILYQGKVVPRIGAIDFDSAKALSYTLLIDKNGNMLFGSRYRKALKGLDVLSLRPLNRHFLVDKARVYALTDSSLCLCEFADRESVEPEGNFRIRDKLGSIGLNRRSGGAMRIAHESSKCGRQET